MHFTVCVVTLLAEEMNEAVPKLLVPVTHDISSGPLKQKKAPTKDFHRPWSQHTICSYQ